MTDYYSVIASGGPDPTEAIRYTAELAEHHSGQASQLDQAHSQTLNGFRPRFNVANHPSGQAGAALDSAIQGHAQLHAEHAQAHRQAADAADQARYTLLDYSAARHAIATDGADACDTAEQQGGKYGPIEAADLAQQYQAQVTQAWSGTAPATTAALDSKFTPPPGTAKKPHKQGDDPDDPDSGKPDAGDPTDDRKFTPTPVSAAPQPASAGAGAGGSPASGGFTPPMPGSTPKMPSLSSAAKTSPASAPSPKISPPLTGLSPASPTPSPSGLSTAAPRTAAAPPAQSAGVGNLGAAFNSGLASTGMRATPAPIAQSARPLAPFSAPQPATAAPLTVAGQSTPAVPAGDVHGPAPALASAPSGGGGVPMMGAPMGSGPLAPYSTPGAGSAISAPPATSPVSTAATAASGSGSAGVALAPPAAASTQAAVTTRDPHLSTALTVLAGLVRGTDLCGLRVAVGWAVGVFEVACVQHVVIASSVGGGDWIPATVFPPAGVKLATRDPLLIAGWAGERFMGWQRPTAILEAHFEALRTAPVFDPRVLAIATTEMWPRRPACGGAYESLTDREVLSRPGMAPVLDAAHTHRLVVLDPVFAAHLGGLCNSVPPEGRAARYRELAAAVTDAVVSAAGEPDGTGEMVAAPADADMWAKAKASAATEEDWRAWREDVDGRDFPEMYAPRDLDDSSASAAARLFYRHHYSRARVAELVGCWRSSGGLFDVAYCGITAGYGPQLAAAV